MIEYCSKCDREMNGFNYGYGVNNVCGDCHSKSQLMHLSILELINK